MAHLNLAITETRNFLPPGQYYLESPSVELGIQYRLEEGYPQVPDQHAPGEKTDSVMLIPSLQTEESAISPGEEGPSLPLSRTQDRLQMFSTHPRLRGV